MTTIAFFNPVQDLEVCYKYLGTEGGTGVVMVYKHISMIYATFSSLEPE